MKRTDFYNNYFSAGALFIAALIIMPALLFNPVTEARAVQFLFFWFLAFLTGKKINIFFTLTVTFFIIVFNLFIPYGMVLFSIGVFKITSGALEAGIHRAVTLQALFMLSKAAIRQDLKLPGSFGGLLSESMRIFSVLMSRKYSFLKGAREGNGIISSIDKMLLELSSVSQAENDGYLRPDVRVTKTRPAGFVILLAAVVLSWLPWLFFKS